MELTQLWSEELVERYITNPFEKQWEQSAIKVSELKAEFCQFYHNHKIAQFVISKDSTFYQYLYVVLIEGKRHDIKFIHNIEELHTKYGYDIKIISEPLKLHFIYIHYDDGSVTSK